MNYLIIGVFVVLCIIEATYLKKKYKREVEQDFSAYEQRKTEMEQNLAERQKLLDQHYQQILQQHNEKVKQLNLAAEQQRYSLQAQGQQLQQSLQREKDNFETNLLEYKSNRQKITDEQVSRYETEEKQKIELKLKEQQFNTQRTCEELQEDLTVYGNEVKKNLGIEISALLQELEDYKKKQDAINQAILLEKQAQEQNNIYKIILSDEDKADINFLISIISNLKHKEVLYKLIWSEFLQRPFNEMIKTQFGANIPKNVIYKITNINTHEIYIGKTKSEVSKRWTEHIKTSLFIGGVARSQIHEALYHHWDEFTFQVLEVINEDSKLGEKEKDYIAFYQSDKYGYNIKKGG